MIVWVDIETTGLDWKKELLLEIAVVITDDELNEAESYSRVIHHPMPRLNKAIRRMNDYVLNMHTSSGLLGEIAQGMGKDHGVVESEILEMLDRHGLRENLLMAGSSVHFDRRMLETRMPKLSQRFGYRILDVTSFSEVARRWMKSVYWSLSEASGKAEHRAYADILSSIQRMADYRRLILTDESDLYIRSTRGE